MEIKIFIRITIVNLEKLTTRLVSFRTERYSLVNFEPSCNNKLKNCSAVEGKTSWRSITQLYTNIYNDKQTHGDEGKKMHTLYIPTKASSLIKGFPIFSMFSSVTLSSVLFALTELLCARSSDSAFSYTIEKTITWNIPKKFKSPIKLSF